MKHFPRRLALLVAAVLAAGAVHADGPFRNTDNKSANDAGGQDGGHQQGQSAGKVLHCQPFSLCG